MYIMRICKYYDLRTDQLDMLFRSLIISLFLFGIEVCGGAYKKYLRQIDRSFKYAFKYGYVSKQIFIEDLIRNRDYQLCNKIVEDPNHVLYDLLPPKRER